MGLDIRWPIGIMFTLIGAMLTVSGLLAKPENYHKALDVNINLVWGLVLLVFGAFMLIMAMRGSRAASSPSTTSPGTGTPTKS